MSYGIFQEYYLTHQTLSGNYDLTGIIGMTSNGVMYLSMPLLFALFTKRWAKFRQTAMLSGTILACLSFLLSSFSTQVWHLVATQGVLACFGSALVFSPMTLSLGEWYKTDHRALAYGVTLSCKNIVGFSAAYGIPQTYLNTYASEVALLSHTSAIILLTLFNIPGIASSSFFGYLSDNKHSTFSATTVACISAMSSGLSAILLWGLNTQGSLATLILFSITFGFFAGGYSATWGGLINDLELEARRSNEAIDSGMVYGVLNGARGVGYIVGGLIGVPLLQAGTERYVQLVKGDFGGWLPALEAAVSY
ncbi:MFS general substrate transporter [Aureobasidium pullulans]|uniref:MFS general substrate transporter n=1 Tax=Aureobasidium pullulans TaxID=5580 RepID=A0A4S9A4M9_AURPU|nr:MFS general substrate transporter [Aureobasidium pullulans]